MNRYTIIIAGCLLMLASCGSNQDVPAVAAKPNSLPYYTTTDFTPHWIDKGSPELDSIHTIPPFSFSDQEGNDVTERTIANKIYVADFFFTSCTGLCPRLTKNLCAVQATFKDDSDIMILSHSVMPDKDDIIQLQRYAYNYGINYKQWRLLTGNKDSIYTIARKAYFADEDMGLQKTTNDFLHTENILLIDQHRRIRGIYRGSSSIEINNLIADIKLLKLEDQ